MQDSQSNIEVVDAALGAIQSGDLDGALGRFEDEARWQVASFLPQPGWHDGRDAIKNLLGSVSERFPGGYRFLDLRVYGTPDHVFAETIRTAGTHANAEGSEHVMLSFQVVMGRIRDVREFVYEVK